MGLDYEVFVKEVRKQNEIDGLSDYEQIRQENIAKRKINIARKLFLKNRGAQAPRCKSLA